MTLRGRLTGEIIHGAGSIQHTIARVRTAIHPEWRTMEPLLSCSGIDVLTQNRARQGLELSPLPFVGPYVSHRSGCVMSLSLTGVAPVRPSHRRQCAMRRPI